MLSNKFLAGLIERAVASYCFAVLTFVLANGFDFTDLSAMKAAALAGIPAALSVVKSALSTFVGEPESGAFVE